MSFKPNNWELHDMHGNVWEWCSNYFGKYNIERTNDPTGPLRGNERVMRGGSWSHSARRARSASRRAAQEDFQEHTVGLRVVMDVV